MLKDPKDPAGEKLLTPSALVKERHKPRLPSIEGVVFNQLSLQARLSIKKAGCRVEVIKIGSLQSMKYEVFERLNTGGSGLEPQEVRNCICRSTNPGFIEWVDDLASFAPFQNNLGLSQKQKNTMYDKGLILRYLALKHAYNEFQHDVEPFITDFVRQVVEHDRPFDRNNEAETFRETFQMIADALGEDAWRHYRDGRHKGPLSVYIFEALAIGVAENLCSLKALSESSLKNRIIAFKQEDEFIKNTGAGANVKSKLRDRISFALSYFAKPEGS
ncbi:MAG: hypothetical protein ACXW1O_08355 [Halobacteriota archaeon]